MDRNKQRRENNFMVIVSIFSILVVWVAVVFVGNDREIQHAEATLSRETAQLLEQELANTTSGTRLTEEDGEYTLR